jgi:predicted N-acetyltransferase YhbS
MNEPSIRTACLEDIDSLARLSDQLGYPYPKSKMLERVREVLESDEGRLLVAESDGRVVGWIHVIRYGSIHSDPSAAIVGLIVDEAYRSRGIGKKLIRAAERWGRARGIERFIVRSNEKRPNTVSFYTANGYNLVKKSNVFQKRIGGHPDEQTGGI